MSVTIPSDAHVIGDTGHTSDHDDIADTLGLVAQALAQLAGNGLPYGSSHNAANITQIEALISSGHIAQVAIAPSGDSTGATDTTAINNALAANGRVNLLPGTYYTNAPLIIPGNTHLTGAHPVTYSGDNVQGAWTGTTISPVAGFNKGSYAYPAAVFLGDGLGTATFQGPGLQDMLVNCSNAPSGVAGIVAYGPVQALTLRQFGVWHSQADGVGLYASPTAKPDGGNIDIGIIQSCRFGNGMVIDGADYDVSAVHSQTNHLDGFVITHANNVLRGCRADHNNNGYTTGVSASGAVFNTIRLIGCSSQGNNYNGLNATTGESTGVSLTAPVICTGCAFQGDGANGGAGGGGYAGIAASGTVVVIVHASSVTVDTTDASGGSPQYGIATAAAGTSGGVPQLVQVIGGFYGSVNSSGSAPMVNDAAPATLMSYSFHGFAGGPLADTSAIAHYQNPSPSASTPAFPASGTSVTNDTGGDVVIYLSGGTVTQVQIRSVTLGATGGMFYLPAGRGINITYTGTPSWVWQSV